MNGSGSKLVPTGDEQHAEFVSFGRLAATQAA